MLTLLRVQSATDWKGRPDVSVSVVGRSDKDRDELIKLQDADIAELQAGDIEVDKEMEAENAASEGRPVIPHSGVWALATDDCSRWEMDVQPGELRQLAGKHGDGDMWSTTYHIVDDRY